MIVGCIFVLLSSQVVMELCTLVRMVLKREAHDSTGTLMLLPRATNLKLENFQLSEEECEMIKLLKIAY